MGILLRIGMGKRKKELNEQGEARTERTEMKWEKN